MENEFDLIVIGAEFWEPSMRIMLWKKDLK